jgi:hypothetical protein
MQKLFLSREPRPLRSPGLVASLHESLVGHGHKAASCSFPGEEGSIPGHGSIDVEMVVEGIDSTGVAAGVCDVYLVTLTALGLHFWAAWRVSGRRGVEDMLQTCENSSILHLIQWYHD